MQDMRGVILVFSMFFIVSLIAPATAQNVFIVGVESNPAGQDSGNEWVLLFNADTQPMDLSRWSIITEDHDMHLLHQTIPACSSMEVRFPKQFIDNRDATITLLDSSGTKIDSTPPISDGRNDGGTWSISTPKCDNDNSVQDTSLPVPRSPAVLGDVFEVTFVDLGNAGESILLIAPDGASMLIDGGLARSGDRLEHILSYNNIDSIDVMVATHADQDHIEGLTTIIQNPDIEVKRVLLSHVDATTKTYEKFVRSISSLQIPSEIVYAGHTINLTDSFTARVISPPPNGIHDSSDLRNANSLVIHVEYGAVSFLFTGDTTAKTEEWIVHNMPELDIDIMNGPHHGSHHSNTAFFIDHLTPQLVIFSADADNRYGHPHPNTISRYDNRGIANYQTGVDGSIEIRTDGVGCSLILTDIDHIPCYNGISAVGSTQPSLEDPVPSEPETVEQSVPDWIKNTAGLWYKGLITDQEFIGGIQYLIEHRVIFVQHIQDTQSMPDDRIPEWIKTNAGLWEDGHISDEVFLNGIEFLVGNGIIKITVVGNVPANRTH